MIQNLYMSFFSRNNLIIFLNLKRGNKSWSLLLQGNEIEPSFALFDDLSWYVKAHANGLFFHFLKIGLIVRISNLRDVFERIEDIFLLILVHAFAIIIHD